ncbi:MAG TPA: malto-oligosyltrehalose trehalohydrolase [Steroidobacteraceae bacterium]|nr:malto-oligosyltrehalose trehalohydrolase [Steroidobacteraceae bacterium]
MQFCVWAPLATKSVELVCADQRFAMVADDEGYWRIDCTPERIASGYRFAVDGGPPLPDPRSRWQPEGVHGPSFVVDAGELRAISRSDFRQKPLREAVIYELHVGTFTPEGTYAGAQRRLPHLSALGVTHIELMPLATFPGRHGWGYDGVYLFAPQPSYGTPAELAQFVAAAHAQGMAVLLDVVYNHLGPDGNYLGQFGPYFTDRVRTGWGEAVNYDGPYSDGVRRFVIDNARTWLEDYGFDGLRLDAVHAIYGFEAVHVLEELAAQIQTWAAQADRSVVLIAESDLNDPRLVRSRGAGGYGLDAHWEDDFHHALHRVMTGETSGYYMDFNGINDLAISLRDAYVYRGQYSPHRRRRHGRAPLDVRPEQLVVSAQNHDQIGNRAQGERLSMLLNDMQLKAVAALTILSPFVPMLFQGEEWGARTPFLYFTDHQDRELGKLVAQGRRKEFESFGWQTEVPDPQAASTFERSRLNWEELAQSGHQDLLDWYRRLIVLRASTIRPPSGAAEVVYEEPSSWLTFVLGDLCVAVNFAGESVPFALPAGHWRLLMTSAQPHADSARLAAYETRIHIRGP